MSFDGMGNDECGWKPGFTTFLKELERIAAARQSRKRMESQAIRPKCFKNPLGVDEDAWVKMNRAERRKFIKEHRRK